jgi:hypothetical protein
MKVRTINMVILFAIISMVCILIIQIIWIRNTQLMQKENVEIQQKQVELNKKHFIGQTISSLQNTRRIISKQTADSTDQYGAVQQLGDNYFLVEISDELQLFYLETILKREFYQSGTSPDGGGLGLGRFPRAGSASPASHCDFIEPFVLCQPRCGPRTATPSRSSLSCFPYLVSFPTFIR